MNNKNKKEKLEQVWLQQKEIMKKITGNENEKMDILDEKYTDEDGE